jgi:hypothetical protein
MGIDGRKDLVSMMMRQFAECQQQRKRLTLVA